MRCPFCGHDEDRVIDSRSTEEGTAIRRRRECLKCLGRFTSYERVESHPLVVIKKDGRREPFDRQKVLSGMLKACQKRSISTQEIERIVSEIEKALSDRMKREVESSEIGELVMERLQALDQVAYVRFASVYRRFEDASDFVKEVKGLAVGDQETDPRDLQNLSLKMARRSEDSKAKNEGV
jgi:transcriptional repressor NrdR